METFQTAMCNVRPVLFASPWRPGLGVIGLSAAGDGAGTDCDVEQGRITSHRPFDDLDGLLNLPERAG